MVGARGRASCVVRSELSGHNSHTPTEIRERNDWESGNKPTYRLDAGATRTPWERRRWARQRPAWANTCSRAAKDVRMNDCIVIPAYNPREPLLQLVQELQGRGLKDIVVVDDGSEAQCAPIFERLASSEGVHLLRHAINLGKGAALKT